MYSETELPPMAAKLLLRFWLLWMFRYIRLVAHIVVRWRYSPTQIPKSPSFHSSDVTIIIPTLGEDIGLLRQSIQSHLDSGCGAILVCGAPERFKAVKALIARINQDAALIKIGVLEADHASKRRQIEKAVRSLTVSPKILAFADDDITYGPQTLPWLLAPFEDGNVAGVASVQQTRRLEIPPWVGWRSLIPWLICPVCDYIFADYIERRNFENMATVGIDGSISCLSGRFMVLRGDIVRESGFLEGYVSEEWKGKQLGADDDNYITRYLLERGWKIDFQSHPDCVVETKFDPRPWNVIRRNLRWSRSNWRSNAKSLRNPLTWQKYPWGVYALYVSGWVNFGAVDFYFFYLAWTEDIWWYPVWWLLTKAVKRIGLYRRDWRDAMFLPASIVWGYLHGFIKLCALCTLSETGW